MEIDAINTALAAKSTQSLDQHRLGINKNPVRNIDLSQEHTNGRMFEQAVQNANKAGETSASSNDNVKLSNSKVDGNSDAKNENPLTLNQKDARIIKQQFEPEEEVVDNSGEASLKQALKNIGINYLTLCQMSKDTIFVKASAIDKILSVEDKPHIKSEENTSDIKFGASSNVTQTQLKRQQVQKLAEEAYHDIDHLESEEGHEFQTSIIQGLDEADFGKDVVSLVFDRPVLLIQN